MEQIRLHGIKCPKFTACKDTQEILFECHKHSIFDGRYRIIAQVFAVGLRMNEDSSKLNHTKGAQ